MVPFPRRGFFWHSLWEPVSRAPRDKIHRSVGATWWLGPPEVLSLRVVHPKCPAICQLQFRLPYPNTGSCLWVSALVNCDSLYLSVNLSNLQGRSGGVVCPLTSLILQSKKTCWFFHLFSFLLIVKIEWQLLSFLHAGLETRSPLFLFINSTLNLFLFVFQYLLTHAFISP